MYTITCDGHPLLDLHDPDFYVVSPVLKLEANTVGECSFTIYKSHPNFDKVKKRKSVFEVKDDSEILFRGYATGETVDIEHGKAVDLEGSMAFFNDSVVRPFLFPGDFTEKEDFIASEESGGNRVEYFLNWLIAQHNAQVQEFQRLNLGTVTVFSEDAFVRSSEGYASTWETIKSKLFDSDLGGYLCVRYEEDGTYIDYLSEITETNAQAIEFGENMLALNDENNTTETYTACIPLGKDGLTISELDDGFDGQDVEIKGDMLISVSGVEEYGFICAPASLTTWDDITDAISLIRKGGAWIYTQGSLLFNSVEVTAVDLHFTDAQISSFRIYKNVNVFSLQHGLSQTIPLTKLEIDLLNPQNTKITVGTTAKMLTDRTKTEYITLTQKVNANTDAIQYVSIAITSLKNNVGTAELGSAVNAVTITWAVNKTPASQTLNGEAVSGTSMEFTDPITSDKTYTLVVTDAKGASDTKSTEINFCNGVYYGVMASNATINSAAVLGLTRKLQGNNSLTFTANAGSTQKLCYACPTRYGTPVINIGGFDYEWDKTTIQFTNASGYTETYDVWTSPQTGLGSTTVKVS